VGCVQTTGAAFNLVAQLEGFTQARMHSVISVVGPESGSFLTGVATDSCVQSSRDRLRVAVAFGTCDANTLLGSFWPHRFPEPPALAVYFRCAILFGRSARSSRALFYALPAILSVDNFFAGCRATTALALGFGSTVMAMLGLGLAAVCQRVFVARGAEV
jgi:hypothetical protein